MELEWQQEHLKEGRYTLHMGHIDKKIQEIVKEIIAKEFEESTRLNKVDNSKAQVSIATLALSKTTQISQGYLALFLKKGYRLITIQLFIERRRV